MNNQLDFELIFNVFTDRLQWIGDDISDSGIKVPEWMLVDYDTLQDQIGTLWATYANIEVTECSSWKKDDLKISLTDKVYKFTKYLMNFEYLVQEYIYCTE